MLKIIPKCLRNAGQCLRNTGQIFYFRVCIFLKLEFWVTIGSEYQSRHLKVMAPYNKFSYNTHNFVTPIATAEVSEPFPFDLAFSMTVHKAQGRTIKRVVLDLTNHPTHYSRMEFAAIFVAMSRVKTSEHIRLLAHKRVGHQHNADEAYSYITTLKPSRHACAFYYGYPLGHLEEKYGSIWKPSIALKYKSSYT